MKPRFITSLESLQTWCEKAGFKGWDPFDGLNSSVLQSLPVLKDIPLIRLCWLQAFKHLPINLRRVFGIPRVYNPKGLALFLSGYCNLYHVDPKPEYRAQIDKLVDLIISLQSKGWNGACWGYPFDWQARAFFQPKWTPTVVATTYVGYALLDAFEVTGDVRLPDIARSACDFVLKDLNRTADEHGDFAFSYSPLDKTQVFNASLLGTRLLSRVYNRTHEPELADAARRSAAYCCHRQRRDGAWTYGTLPFHQWVDNFHTGFNLECLHEYERYTGDTTFRPTVVKGLKYYTSTFFTADGKSKYYDNNLYPIDIHAPAQLVITLYRLGRINDYRDQADRVLAWTIDQMQDPSGYFYFQTGRYYTTRIPYMRWAQSWMFFALSCYWRSSK
ncbi:MAG: delta-aminolevulinic acid dehydratase [Candidatus Ozemobacteraceae bacterium]